MGIVPWIIVAAVLITPADPALAAKLTISCSAIEQERALCEQGADAWAQTSGHQVEVVVGPERTNDRYTQYLIELSDADSSVDVFQIDIIWPGLLAEFFLDLRELIDQEAIDQHHPAIIANNTVDGRLVGMPWYTDVGVLFYRKDLLEKHNLEPPRSWSELADIALHVQRKERGAGNKELWGYVFQGGAYEGLTCNALEWIDAYGGGTIVEADGVISIDNPAAVLAVGQAANWVGTIAPNRVIGFNEEDARITFQLGNAVFMRNWPYAWAPLNAADSPVAGKIDIAPLPQGGLKGRSSATLGGWQLAVSKFTENPEVAADLVRFLTSREAQKERAIAGSYAPTIMSLYDDPAVLAANPFFAKLKPVLENAVARPSAQTGSKYMAVTTYFWEAVHDVMEGTRSSADSLARLKNQLRLVKGRGDW